MSAERITQGIDRDLADHFQILDTRFLVAIHHGDVDVVKLARQELMIAGSTARAAGSASPRRASCSGYSAAATPAPWRRPHSEGCFTRPVQPTLLRAFFACMAFAG